MKSTPPHGLLQEPRDAGLGSVLAFMQGIEHATTEEAVRNIATVVTHRMQNSKTSDSFGPTPTLNKKGLNTERGWMIIPMNR